eukprot:m.122554 g.122554  ORF g.122554 m.122554 type:complete len:56 (+) comp13734_c1_seq5:693-860(+)
MGTTMLHLPRYNTSLTGRIPATNRNTCSGFHVTQALPWNKANHAKTTHTHKYNAT